MTSNEPKGLHHRYDVKRRDDPIGFHDECEFFVIDLKHDKYANAALKAIIGVCTESEPDLANDLRARLGIPAAQNTGNKLGSCPHCLTNQAVSPCWSHHNSTPANRTKGDYYTAAIICNACGMRGPTYGYYIKDRSKVFEAHNHNIELARLDWEAMSSHLKDASE